MSALAPILALAVAATPAPERPATLAVAPAAPAGAPAAPLAGDEAVSPWRLALSTGVAGRFGGRRISAAAENPAVLLAFGGEADGSFGEGHGQAVRLRFRLLTGGESGLFVPSDGEAELAWAVGGPGLRFVLARAEVARYPGLALQALAQAGTLPCLEGTLALAGDTAELSWLVAPVEAAWVRYYGGAHLAHLPGWDTESDSPSAASAGRVRATLLLPPAVAVSLAADLVKMWAKADMFLSLEGSIGYMLPRQSATFHATVRWSDYARRGLAVDTREAAAEVVAVAGASLAF